MISVSLPGTYPVTAPSLRFQVTDCALSLLCVFPSRVPSPKECIECLFGVISRYILSCYNNSYGRSDCWYNKVFHFPQPLSFCTQIFIFEFFSLWCIILMMTVIINDTFVKIYEIRIFLIIFFYNIFGL